MKSIVIALPQPQQTETVFDDHVVSESTKSGAALVRRYGLTAVFTALLLCGLVCGALRAVGSAQALTGVETFLITLPDQLGNAAPITVFVDSFCTVFLLFAVMCFSALSPVGLLTVPAVLFLRGFLCGLQAGVLCGSYGFAGLAYFISVLFTGAFLSSAALIRLARFCEAYSCSMLLAVFDNISVGGRTLKMKLKELTLCSAFALIVIAASSLADTALYYLIGRFFSLR